jgi:hypothetical protein
MGCDILFAFLLFLFLFYATDKYQPWSQICVVTPKEERTKHLHQHNDNPAGAILHLSNAKFVQ